MDSFDKLDLCFVSGPLELTEPAYSFDIIDAVEYPPGDIAIAFLEVPGCRLVHPGEPSWYDWKARWESGGRFIEVDMSLYDVEPVMWGGSGINMNCTPVDLLMFWESVRSRCQAVWLCDTECRLYSPERFRELYAREGPT